MNNDVVEVFEDIEEILERATNDLVGKATPGGTNYDPDPKIDMLKNKVFTYIMDLRLRAGETSIKQEDVKFAEDFAKHCFPHESNRRIIVAGWIKHGCEFVRRKMDIPDVDIDALALKPAINHAKIYPSSNTYDFRRGFVAGYKEARNS